jgi:hypothetical protein
MMIAYFRLCGVVGAAHSGREVRLLDSVEANFERRYLVSFLQDGRFE